MTKEQRKAILKKVKGGEKLLSTLAKKNSRLKGLEEELKVQAFILECGELCDGEWDHESMAPTYFVGKETSDEETFDEGLRRWVRTAMERMKTSAGD